MISFRLANSEDDFRQILLLQRKNLKAILDQKEINKEGFVSIEHKLDDLERMNETYHHALATDQNKVIGFALVTTHSYGNCIPFLSGKFEMIDGIESPYGKLNSTNYFLMGQVCIDKPYRGQGIFKSLYHSLKMQLYKEFKYCITIISEENKRSVRAHEKVGFMPIHKYKEKGSSWTVVLWDWK